MSEELVARWRRTVEQNTPRAPRTGTARPRLSKQEILDKAKQACAAAERARRRKRTRRWRDRGGPLRTLSCDDPARRRAETLVAIEFYDRDHADYEDLGMKILAIGVSRGLRYEEIATAYRLFDYRLRVARDIVRKAAWRWCYRKTSVPPPALYYPQFVLDAVCDLAAAVLGLLEPRT